MNSFGLNLRLTTFGESHGKAIGGIIDGFPPGFKIDFYDLSKAIAERRPGSSINVTQRQEDDMPEFLSGINEEGITLGTPIGFIIRNKDSHSRDYDELETKYRPNHADYTYDARYGMRDHRGGGRSSARETANWVVAGALANQLLKKKGISVSAILSSVGNISFTKRIIENLSISPLNLKEFLLTDNEKAQIEDEIASAKRNGDSIGGIITCLITGVKAGMGNPVFDKLQSRLAQAMLSINAVKGFEYGLGTSISSKFGSEILDTFDVIDSGDIITKSNFSGGIQGGISNGMPIFFNVFFKPTPTILKELNTIDNNKNRVTLKMTGRHDPCVAVRGVPVVKAMASLVLADFMLGGCSYNENLW